MAHAMVVSTEDHTKKAMINLGSAVDWCLYNLATTMAEIGTEIKPAIDRMPVNPYFIFNLTIHRFMRVIFFLFLGK